MEEAKRIAKQLSVEYALLWIISFALVIIFEAGLLPYGQFADDPRMGYVIETLAVLLAIALIPLSLNLFRIALVKRIRQYALADALKAYRAWSRVRLGLLAVIAFGGIVVYYLTMNNIGGLCALMALTASFFCWPGEKRLMQELDLMDGDE